MRSNVLSGDLPVGQLKLTLAKFYRVTGSSTQKMGVAPDITFPTPYDAKEFGEGSRPNALPWDEIESSKFRKMDVITPEIIAKISKVYSKHLEQDEDLKELVKDVDEFKKLKDQKTISLNLEERKAEKSKDEKVDELATKLSGDEVEKEETPEEKLADDPYLKESLRLLAELSTMKN